MGGVGFLVQCRLELLKVPSSLGLEFWNNYYFNLLKIAFLLKIIEVRQAAKHALRKLFPFIDLANVSEMCIASLTDKPVAKKIPDIIVIVILDFKYVPTFSPSISS